VTVIAVLQLIFGGLGLLCTLGGIAGSSFQASGSTGTNNKTITQEDINRELEKRFSAYKAVQVVLIGSGLVLSGLMIASGIGLLQMRSWGRTTAIVWAGLNIAVRIPNVIYSIAVVIPATNAAFETLPGLGQAMAGMTRFLLYFGLVVEFLTVVYPIIVLCVMLNGKVSAAFQKAAARRDDDEDDRDDDRDDDYDDDEPDDYDDRRPRRRDTRYRDR
jgi:hypothetical protein